MGNTWSSPPSKPHESVSNLTRLSQTIEQNTQLLADRLATNGHPAPSFHPGGLAEFPLERYDTEAMEAREELIAATKELHDLVIGPKELLKTLAWDSVSYISLHAISNFQIAKAIPVSSAISYHELSAEVAKLSGTMLPVKDLKRICRLAITNNIFQESNTGHVSHNRTSLLLLEDEELASWVGLYTTDLLGPIAGTVEAMRRWPGSEEQDQTGVNIAYQHSLEFFVHLRADRERALRYNKAMSSHGSREGYEIAHTVDSYPWDRFGSGTVVDVGGNEGFVSVAIASSFPSLSFVVQDLPHTRAPIANPSIPSSLSSRISLTTHNFFESQPSDLGADAFFFRHIFHAFSDKYAIRILRNLIPALRPGVRVIINDLVMPRPGTLAIMEEKSLRTMDMLMKTVCNARERELEDWKGLFEAADDKFKWRGAWKGSGRLWFMEAVWEENS